MQRKYRDQTDEIISMPLFIRTAEAFLHSRKPVRTLNDLKGLKIRTAGAWLEMSKELGAAPVTTPAADIYPMLERGAIDAVEWGTLYENIPMGFHKVAKFVIYPGIHQPCAPFELVINKGVWSKLSEADKKLIEMVAKLTTLESWLTVGQEDAKALDFYRKAGNTIIELSPELQYAARKMGLEWATKTAKENKYPFFASVFESQQQLDKLWEGASGWRTVKTRTVSAAPPPAKK
jgi:TRAP-type mannitol/chloroaromatic compound transport system substrate-binding protein